MKTFNVSVFHCTGDPVVECPPKERVMGSIPKCIPILINYIYLYSQSPLHQEGGLDMPIYPYGWKRMKSLFKQLFSASVFLKLKLVSPYLIGRSEIHSINYFKIASISDIN